MLGEQGGFAGDVGGGEDDAGLIPVLVAFEFADQLVEGLDVLVVDAGDFDGLVWATTLSSARPSRVSVCRLVAVTLQPCR